MLNIRGELYQGAGRTVAAGNPQRSDTLATLVGSALCCAPATLQASNTAGSRVGVSVFQDGGWPVCEGRYFRRRGGGGGGQL